SALASYVTSPEAPLRVDVHRLDDLMNRVSALAMNRAEIAQVRQMALETVDDMQRTIARLSELGTQLADQRGTADGQPLHSATRDDQTQTGFMARLRGGDRRHTRPLAEAAANAVQSSVPSRRDLDLEQYTEYDHLMRALGEAVADISTTATAMRSTLHRLERLDQTQEALASSIQETVNQMRLVPLSNHVPRLQHAVRVLA